MGKKKSDTPQWFKEASASYRAMRAKGDLSSSEMYELLADDIQDRHEGGDPFGRSLWIGFITGQESGAARAQAEAAAEVQALALASGYLQQDLFPREVLDRLGLPAALDLGGYGKSIATPDACHTDMQKYRAELERKRNSWDKSLDDRIEAADRALEILPEDDSRTLRQVISDPEEYGTGTL
jgi:hypothetical protein